MPLRDAARHLYEGCPLCESSGIRFLRETDCRGHSMYNPELPGTIRWMQCDACGHIFTDDFFTDEALGVLLSSVHGFQIPDLRTMERAREASAVMVDSISSVLGKQEGKWLDVGFGNGSLLITYAEYGFEPVGIDLREETVDRIKPFDIEAHCMRLMDLEQFGAFAVISMADVLEHMPYPKQALARAYRLLSPGGVLFVSCPNSDSLLWRPLTESNMNPYWWEIEHYHSFGRKRLYSLLVEHGFTPVKYSTSRRYRVGMEVTSTRVADT